MYDVFDEKLTAVAGARGLVRVAVTIAETAPQAKEFSIARTTDQWVYKANIAALVDLELDSRKDNLHHRSSGLDTTSAGLCARHGTLVAINIANLRTLDPVIIGRVMQNIELCRQHHVSMCVLSFAKTENELPHEQDVRSLLITLGMSPGEAKAATGAFGAAYERFKAK